MLSGEADINPSSMTSSESVGRPSEIEEWSNRLVVHPLSRAVAQALVPTKITPNMVSVLGAVMAAAGAGAFLALPWPAGALVGFGFQVAWHVFDGADGDLARRTGRASTNGELVDGICDHAGQLCIYLAFALLLAPQLGVWAWAAAAAAGLSRAAQASSYEASRKNYRRWVHGGRWIRQTLAAGGAPATGAVGAGLGLAYLKLAGLMSADDRAVEAEMARLLAPGGGPADQARGLYRQSMRPLVKGASVLSANNRTLVAFASVLAGWPLAYLLYEAVLLNVALVVLVASERRANQALVERLRLVDG